jgi:basic amino acid/polyamine antiporter, APA family
MSVDITNPKANLSVRDAVAISVGIVIGAGIFRTPSLVAAHSGTEGAVILLWVAGGLVSLVGALCYAELTSTFPHAGGDYHYLFRAFGRGPAVLFAWARMTIIQTGSIAMIGFLVGDYASEIFHLGYYSSSWYAFSAIGLLTAVNIAGMQQGKGVQKALITTTLFGILFMIVVGFSVESSGTGFQEYSSGASRDGLGKAMIFVLLTYGGWNEAAYLSAEIRGSQRNIVRVLLYSIGVITAVYLLINLALLRNLGVSAMSSSDVVAADMMRQTMGETGAKFISLLIIVTALSTINAMIITGARTSYALGKDLPLFHFLGRWETKGNTPVNALLLQGVIAFGLVLVGTGSRNGFTVMVEYTAPVFWLFFFLIGVSLFTLRRKEPDIVRPFRVPFYPITPFLFCMASLYLFQASLAYTGMGSMVGLGVLLAGLPLLWVKGSKPKKNH